MAHTRAWSDSTPLGSRAAREIDDSIRELKVDIHERMDDIVEDWTADPIVLKSGVSGGGGALKQGVYADSQGAGSKVSAIAALKEFMILYYSGTTSSNGNVVINLNEINTASNDTLNYQINLGDNVTVLAASRTNDGVPIFGRVEGFNGAANTLTFRFRHGDGATVNNHPIIVTFLVTSKSGAA